MQGVLDSTPTGAHRFHAKTTLVERALRGVFDSVRPNGPSRWGVGSEGDEFEVRLARHWVDLVAPAPAELGDSPEDWLAANATGAASVKFSQHCGSTRATATLPLDHPALLESRLRQAHLSIAATRDLGRREDDAPMISSEALRGLFEQAGLSVIERKTDLVVAIDCGPSVLHAVVHDDGGGIRARIELAVVPAGSDGAGSDGAVGHAVAAILWRTNTAVRLTRAELRYSGDEVLGSLQAYLAGAPVPTDLRHLLGSLTVAARMCAREVEALAGDPRMARIFLERTRDTAPPATPTRAPKRRSPTKGESS